MKAKTTWKALKEAYRKASDSQDNTGTYEIEIEIEEVIPGDDGMYHLCMRMDGDAGEPSWEEKFRWEMAARLIEKYDLSMAIESTDLFIAELKKGRG